MNFENASTAITATLIPEGPQRLNFLSMMFGRNFMRGEALVYGWLSRLSEDYNGGFWNYYTLTNGGFYMAPATDKALRLVVAGNWFEGELSADAAGIVATLFALGQIAAEIQGTAEADALIDRYYFLRDFAAEHAEAGLIFRAID